MERLGLEQKSGEAEPSKQELTRQLASKWNTLPPEDKKVSNLENKIEEKIFCTEYFVPLYLCTNFFPILCCQEFF
jgi:hypothetical protein